MYNGLGMVNLVWGKRKNPSPWAMHILPLVGKAIGLDLTSYLWACIMDSSHPDWRVMVPHCGFDLHFSDNE